MTTVLFLILSPTETRLLFPPPPPSRKKAKVLSGWFFLTVFVFPPAAKMNFWGMAVVLGIKQLHRKFSPQGYSLTPKTQKIFRSRVHFQPRPLRFLTLQVLLLMILRRMR